MCFSNVRWDSLAILSSGVVNVFRGQIPFRLCIHWLLFIVYAFLGLSLAVSNSEQMLGHKLHKMHLKVLSRLQRSPCLESEAQTLDCFVCVLTLGSRMLWMDFERGCAYLFENQCIAMNNLNVGLFNNNHRHACSKLPNVFLQLTCSLISSSVPSEISKYSSTVFKRRLAALVL